MPVRFDIKAGDAFQEVEFSDAGRAYTLRVSWEDRLQAYYVDVRDADTGEGVALNRRLSPNSRIARLPSGGVLYGAGARDPYARLDLGPNLAVGIFYAEEVEQT